MTDLISDLILLLLLGVCWTWGIFTLFHDGYILSRIGDILRIDDDETSPPKKKGTWVSKPLFDCPPCMASIHGFIIGIIFFDGEIYLVLAYMICLCGFNFIIKSILFPEYE